MGKRIDTNYIPPLTGSGQPAAGRGQKAGDGFQEYLKKASGVKFSGHALERLEGRSLSLGQGQLQKIENALDQAEQKGARETLLICENLVLVASVDNRTVITAVGQEGLKDRVFTHIDSAVFIK